MPALILTFDVEEFDLPLEFGNALPMARQIDIGAQGWQRALDLTESLGIRATLFTTALIAREHPDLLARSSAHHEIASHNLCHDRSCPPYPSRSREALRELCGQPVLGYRSPRFAPVADHALLDAGYAYNSSLNPVWLPGRYNHLRKPRRPFTQNGLAQFPLSASPHFRIPLFWLAFKNLPLPAFEFLCRWTLRHDGHLHLLFHPWEFCDLGGFGLPAFLRRVDGTRLAGRLHRLLARLRGTVEVLAAADFLAAKNLLPPPGRESFR